MGFAASDKALAQTQFVQTGPNTYQNGLYQFVVTKIGILFTWAESQTKFVAYDPANLTADTNAIFFRWKSNQFSEVSFGGKTYPTRGTVGVGSSKIQFLVNKGLLRVLVDKTMIAFYGTKVLGFVSDEKLLQVLFKMDKAIFGTYELKSDAFYLDNTELKNNTPIGLNLKTEDSECEKLPLISHKTAEELKKISDPVKAKIFLSNALKTEGNDLKYNLQGTIMVQRYMGFSPGTAELIEIEQKNEFCILKATPLS